MSWFAQAFNKTEAAKEHVCMFLAASFAFPSGTLRFWTGLGNLTFGGNTYTGVGQLGRVDVKSEYVRLVAEKKTYQILSVDPLLASESDIDNCFGASVTEYFGFLAQDGTIVAQPEINWEGRMDSIRRVYGKAPLIEVNAEHRLAMMSQTDNWRYTHEHQQVFFPGDQGLSLAPTVDTTTVVWGAYPAVIGTVHTSTGPTGPYTSIGP